MLAELPVDILEYEIFAEIIDKVLLPTFSRGRKHFEHRAMSRHAAVLAIAWVFRCWRFFSMLVMTAVARRKSLVTLVAKATCAAPERGRAQLTTTEGTLDGGSMSETVFGSY